MGAATPPARGWLGPAPCTLQQSSRDVNVRSLAAPNSEEELLCFVSQYDSRHHIPTFQTRNLSHYAVGFTRSHYSTR